MIYVNIYIGIKPIQGLHEKMKMNPQSNVHTHAHLRTHTHTHTHTHRCTHEKI